MKKFVFVILCSFSLLFGCTNKKIHVKHDVAISSDSERIAYSVYGAGKSSLIFIHGWSCDSRYWEKQLSVFSKNYQVITLDLAGHGNSSLDRIDYTMLSFANDVKSIIEKEEINSAILVGHSMGGAVIAESAKLMPKEIDGIIGIDTLHNVGEVIPQSVLNEMTEPFDADFKNAVQEFVTPMLPKETGRSLLNWIKEDMSSAPKQIAISAFRNYMGQYVSGEAAHVFEDVNVPVSSINARLWQTNLDDNRKYIKNYKLFYIEETGHFPMLEKPEKFNKLLSEAIKYIEVEKSNKGT